jgi:ATP-dependent helicase HrpA
LIERRVGVLHACGVSDSPIHFPPELPISDRVKDIAVAIDAHPVIIVAGATGSGKTTQLPKIALAMGRGLERQIGVTQPRRLAATSVAARVASELGSPLGTDVGYQVRFDDRTSPSTYVKFMTDGILLAEIHGDPLLHRYDTIILDEAHERSLTIDFLLGWVKRILPQRPDLKVIVSSATLETERFSAFFDGAPVIEVEGRTYPVDVLYEPPASEVDLPDAVVNVTTLDPDGDILVFLPGEREIRDTEAELLRRNLRHTVIQPLYARLSAGEQARVFTRLADRRVILATNVAETSVTIPGIVYVVDTGVARLSRYDGRSGTTRLQVEAISKASADQRKGRCGRVRSGVCVRLYDEVSWAARPDFTDPEIKRTGLAGVILRMKSLGLGDVEDYSFLDPPQSRAITEGYRVLEELGAIDDRRELTVVGRQLARFPVDPRIGRMILAGAEHRCLREVLVVAAALNIQDPRERPREKRQKADELHRRFADERSDFVSLVRLWEFVKEAEKKGTGNLRRTCQASFLSFLRVREWGEIHRQLEEIVRELGLDQSATARAILPTAKMDDNALHRALLTGLLSKVGTWNAEAKIYLGARQNRFALHPSSSLAKRPPAWIMAFELVETTQLFARTAARIDPEWLLEAAPHLLKRSYSDPHWSEKSARASVREHITLLGLMVAKDRSTDYAKVEPAAARRMFVDHAMVRGEYRSRGHFQAKNALLLESVARLRDKARVSDMLADDEALFDFFDKKLPPDAFNGQRFEVWREEAERTDPSILLLSISDVLVGDDALSASDYPDELELHGAKVPASYRFDPAADDDGVTLTIPFVLLPQLDPGELEWTIPGWQAEKIASLLHDLPKATRKEIGEVGTVNDVARDLARRLVPFTSPMTPALASALSELTRSRVTADLLRPETVPPFLRFYYRVIGEGGKVVAEGRELAELQARFGARARDALRTAAPVRAAEKSWERNGVTQWDFGALAPFVLRRVAGVDVRAYPAIVDNGKSVDLALLESAAAAESASRKGIRRLFMIAARGNLSSIAPRLPKALTRPDGAMATRARNDVFQETLLGRIVDAAFGLEGDAPLPRTKEAFSAQLSAGLSKLDGLFRVFTSSLSIVALELDKTVEALRDAAKHPSGRAAVLDLQSQVEALVPEDLLATISLARLDHYPRYLKAARTRLQRAVVDPRKDADKLAPVAALAASFAEKKKRAVDRAEIEEVRWLFEELRVAVFAPELKTPVAVSGKRIADSIAQLTVKVR